MNLIGVIEGFFGPQWPHPARLSYAEFLSRYGGDFYIYAPKQDPFLRKKWRETWTEEYRSHLRSMIEHFHKHQIRFGVGFSPFGLGTNLSLEDVRHLEEKLRIMSSLKIDILGLFFDDMPVTDNLAKTQIETLNLVQKNFSGKIIFCPSYYTPDPILDKVFGTRPVNYLNEIADGVSKDVLIAWTGPKVISPEIPDEHLRETEALLKRKPFIWENIFANDGPKNCKFLKLRPFSGRSAQALSLSEGFGFNMMNQPELSKLTYLSSLYVLRNGEDSQRAFINSYKELCTPQFARFLESHKETLLKTGLDNISQDQKEFLIGELQECSDAAAKEVIDWLSGSYNVGSECLTD